MTDKQVGLDGWVEIYPQTETVTFSDPAGDSKQLELSYFKNE